MAGLGRTPFPDKTGVRGMINELTNLETAAGMHLDDARKRSDLGAEVALESIRSTVGSAKRQAERLLRYFEAG